MKVSLNTMRFMNRRYGCGDSLERYDLQDLLQKIGGQLGAIEEVIELGKKYDNIVVVRVVSCKKHDNADKLQVCKIDDNKATKSVARDDKGFIQVVCGALNVKAGMLAVWIPPGVTVPSTVGKDPFILEARALRGQMSNGMLASLHELGIGDDHSGILEVEKDVRPGTAFAEAYELTDDIVIDIENKMFTHRPDCFGFLGVARELAGIQQRSFKSPGWYRTDAELPAIETDELKLEIHNEIPKLVPRFSAITMSGVEVGPSPIWLQVKLSKVGIRSINNIVDYTNFFMLETAQPLHAYDYDKVKALDPNAKHATITIRHPKTNEKITLLGGKEVKPSKEAILIASATKPIGIGGVMGGVSTEVDENTKNIILECANFNMYSIRRTSMEQGLFTDAVTRFNKGQSPLQTRPVLAKIVDEIRRFAGGKVAGKLHDVKSSKLESNKSVAVTAEFVNERLGTKLSLKDIAQLLKNVEFEIKSVPADKKRLHVQAPFWRTDIEIPEDIVEEVGRLYGYDHLPLVLPRRDLTPAQQNDLLEIKQKLRDALSAAGANELLTYSFVHGNLLEKAGLSTKNAYKLSNALSPDLQYMRMSMVPNLLEKVHPNVKAGFSEFGLFEIGTVHNKDLTDKDGLPIEEHRLGFVFAADEKAAQNYKGAAYYQARRYAEQLTETLGVPTIYHPATEHQPTMEVGKAALAPFEPKRTAYIRTPAGTLIGEIGEFKPSVRRNLKLPDYVAGFELDIEALLKHAAGQSYTRLSRFPSVEQDISLRVPRNVPNQELAEFLDGQLEEHKPDNSEGSFKTLDIFHPEKSSNKHVTFRLTIASYERTLIAQVVNELLDAIATDTKEKFGAERL